MQIWKTSSSTYYYIGNIFWANSIKLNCKLFEGCIIQRRQFHLTLRKIDFTGKFSFPYFSISKINTVSLATTDPVFRFNSSFYRQFDQTQCSETRHLFQIMGTIEQKNLYLFILHNLTYQQNMMVHTKESRIVHKQMAE